MEAGKHVYSAVPAAYSLYDCDARVRADEHTGMIYMNGETSYFRPEAAYCRRQAAEGAFGEFVYGQAEYFHDMDHGLYDVYRRRWGAQFDMTKTGDPPMHYATHSTSFTVVVMGAHMTSVCSCGYELHGDKWHRRDTIHKNPYSNEVALFEMSNGASPRIYEMRHIGHPGGERASGIYGTEGSFEQNAAGTVWCDKIGCTLVTPPTDHEVLPESLRDDLGGHGGSHTYLVNEFVDSVNRERMPRINLWEAVRYCASGIVAHRSAMRDGERLAVPDWGDAPR